MEKIEIKENKNIVILKKTIVSDFLTPVSAFTCFKENRYSFLFESAERGKAGRYSFIGLSPKFVYEIYKDKVTVLKRETGEFSVEQEIETKDPLSVIEDVLDKYKIEEKDGFPPFCGGLVGYLGYEIIDTWENIGFKNPSEPEMPLGMLIYTDEIIAFDHLYNTVEIIKLVIKDQGDSHAAEEAGAKRIRDIISILEQTPESLKFFPLDGREDIKVDSNFSKEEFEKRVENIKEEIFSGEIIQGVFSQRLETISDTDSFNYYRALRAINPSPYMFYLKLDDVVLCGSSPEVLVKVKSDKVLVRPIAGTRPRGSNEEEERHLAEDLKADIKERAEHIMLVDLGRNDVGKVSEYGSVEVSKLMAIEKYSHVIHMVTDVAGTLNPGVSNVDVFKACFPAGTVSGAPKIRAIEIIEQQENLSRGPYAGAVGYFSFTGDMDVCIAIRTMVIHSGKVYVQAGAGIVADSVPEKEYQETLNKARALLEAVKLGKEIK
jgi:anthranilate synthase component 1